MSNATTEKGRRDAMLEAIVGAERLEHDGRQMAGLLHEEPVAGDVQRLLEFARAVAGDTYMEPYDPVLWPQDRVAEDSYAAARNALVGRELAAAHALAHVNQRKEERALIGPGPLEPKVSKLVAASAAVFLGISTGPTLHDQLLARVEDGPLALFLALVIGGVASVLLTSGQLDTLESGKRSIKNIGALIAGVAVGVGMFLFRISDDPSSMATDSLSWAFSIIELGTVAYLEAYGKELRGQYRLWADHDEKARRGDGLAMTADQEYEKRVDEVEAVRTDIAEHLLLVSTRHARAMRQKELIAVAETAVMRGYHQRLNENRARRLGIREHQP